MKYLILLTFYTLNLRAQYIEVDLNTKDLTPLPIVKDHGRAPAKVEDPVSVQDANRNDNKFDRSPAVAPDEYNFQEPTREASGVEK